MALSVGLSYPHKLGGIIAFKGHIPKEIDDHLTVKQNIWATNSKGDKTIPFEMSKEYYDKYTKKGYNITLFELSSLTLLLIQSFILLIKY